MVRTQIQLPEPLYRDLKRLAEEREWSLAETLRRAAELLLASYPSERASPATWTLPEPRELGEFAAAVEDWRALANEADPS
jgi:hypothetical protein